MYNRRGFTIQSVGGAGGTTTLPASGSFDVDAIEAIHARWPRVAEWWPDATQQGFPATLFRFATTDTLVEPTGASFNASIRHRALTDDNGIGTTACVIRDGLVDGSDGNQSVTMEAAFEAIVVMRYDTIAAGQWGGLLAFESAGSFPFSDIFGLDNVIGVGYTTVDTDTDIADLECISTSGTTAGTRTRTTLTGARDEDQWIMCSIYIDRVAGTARFRVRNLVTNVEQEATHSTNLPSGVRLHVGVLANNGGAAACAISVAYIAVGTTA